MDLLAEKLSMDPVELRLKNAILPGDTTPTKQVLNHNTGNLPSCISKVAKRLEWARGHRKTIMNTPDVNGVVVRSRGIACFWKAPAIPTNTDAGTILTFNEDGSVNLITGIVEIGTGTQTALAQIVAERLGIDPGTVHVVPEVMTDRSPHDWTTAASRSLFMAGNAAISAVEDVLDQIKKVASVPLCCPKDDLEVAGGKVFPRDNPEKGLPLKEVVLGYVFPNGNAIGGPIIGKGRYIARHLTGIDPETGEGNPCLDYTLGAEGVEVEVDLNDGSYKILKAVCTMDVGKVINEQLARGQVVGGIAMGLGFSTQEVFRFDGRERVQNAVLRDYKTPRYGDHPEYIVDFIETPQRDGPYGARGLGEQGVLGIPGALANALSRAIGRPLNHLPLTPENIWSALRGNRK
jgi:CO/xanthine dehydrogenase Mo-binding subunit